MIKHDEKVSPEKYFKEQIIPEIESKKNENCSQYNVILTKKEPHKDIVDESELQVKLADLGNACWSVCKIFYS